MCKGVDAGHSSSGRKGVGGKFRILAGDVTRGGNDVECVKEPFSRGQEGDIGPWRARFVADGQNNAG
jgi:hypothetical protein